MMIITQSAAIEACSKCPVEEYQGKCQKSGTHLHGGKTESAWCVNSRRHFPPGGHVLFTFCRNGNQISKRRSSQETSCQPSSLVPYHRGPMKCVVSFDLWENWGTERTGKLFHLRCEVRSESPKFVFLT